MISAIEAIRNELEKHRRIVSSLEQALAALQGVPVTERSPGKADAPRTAATPGARSSSIDRIVQALQGRPPMPTRELIKASGLSQPTVAKVLKENPSRFRNVGSGTAGVWTLA